MPKKIPGKLFPLPRSEIDGKVEKLDLKTKVELLELLERQDKILSNKGFVNKLPDKGEKIKTFREKLKKEISLRDEVEKSCTLLSNMRITADNKPLDKINIENLEWERNTTKPREYLDSDDDSEPDDPLAIIAKSTDVKKKIVILKEDKSLINSEDLKEIESFSKPEDKDSSLDSNKENDFEEHCKYIFDKTVNKAKPNERKSFKPYQTTISNVHDPSKEGLRKRGKHWEVTAATPPPAIHGPIKEIPLQDSLRLQEIQKQHLKEIQTKHAAEKLAAQLGRNICDLPTMSSISTGSYREVVDIESEDSDQSSDNETSDREVHDEEPNDGGVVFTVMN